MYFLPAVTGTGNTSFPKQFLSSLAEPGAFTIAATGYPHSEFEPNRHTVSVNSGFRQQTLPGFIESAEPADRPFYKGCLPNKKNTSHISSKQYLFHIYPSHNFW